MNDTLEELKSVIDERFIAINVPELPALEIDPTQIGHVLTNLLENAIRYAPFGSPIEISAHLYGKYIRVDIADHGSGISETEAKHLFDEFYQGKKASSRGKGLGLAVCKALIEAHDGHIWVDNIVGGGTVFRFTLPLPEMKGVEDESTSATYSRG